MNGSKIAFIGVIERALHDGEFVDGRSVSNHRKDKFWMKVGAHRILISIDAQEMRKATAAARYLEMEFALK